MLIFPFQPSENQYQCSEYKFFLDKLYLKSYYCVKLIVIIFWFGGKSSVSKKNLPKISCFQIISSVLERKNLLFSRKSFQKSSVFRWILLVGLLIWENVRLTGLQLVQFSLIVCLSSKLEVSSKDSIFWWVSNLANLVRIVI